MGDLGSHIGDTDLRLLWARWWILILMLKRLFRRHLHFVLLLFRW